MLFFWKSAAGQLYEHKVFKINTSFWILLPFILLIYVKWLKNMSVKQENSICKHHMLKSLQIKIYFHKDKFKELRNS